MASIQTCMWKLYCFCLKSFTHFKIRSNMKLHTRTTNIIWREIKIHTLFICRHHLFSLARIFSSGKLKEKKIMKFEGQYKNTKLPSLPNRLSGVRASRRLSVAVRSTSRRFRANGVILSMHWKLSKKSVTFEREKASRNAHSTQASEYCIFIEEQCSSTNNKKAQSLWLNCLITTIF